MTESYLTERAYEDIEQGPHNLDPALQIANMEWQAAYNDEA